MQITGSTYKLRIGFIHQVSMGNPSTWSQKGLRFAQQRFL